MNKLNRLISIAVALIMVLSLAACGGTAQTSQSPSPSGQTSQTPAASSDTPKTEEKIKIKFLSLSSDDNRNNIRENYIKVNAPKELQC